MEQIEIAKNVFLTAEGLAVFRNLRLAAAADLHIGFEASFGEQLARVQTKMILSKFMRVIERFGIKEVLLNGDIKYAFGKESRQEWREIKYFIGELLKKARVKVVKGNHDFYLENMVRDLEVVVSREFEINGVVFTHGDGEVEKTGLGTRSPRSGENSPICRRIRNRKLLVIGNEHPSLKLRDEVGACRKYPCFVYAKNEKILVLPSVNPWAPGTDLLGVQKENFLSPVLRTIELEEARLYPFDGGQIYDFKKVKDIREVLRAK